MVALKGRPQLHWMREVELFVRPEAPAERHQSQQCYNLDDKVEVKIASCGRAVLHRVRDMSDDDSVTVAHGRIAAVRQPGIPEGSVHEYVFFLASPYRRSCGARPLRHGLRKCMHHERVPEDPQQDRA